MIKKFVFSVIILTLLVWLGCSGNSGSLPSMPDYGPESGGGLTGSEPASGENAELRGAGEDFAGHITWGLYQFAADPLEKTLDAAN